MTGSAIAKTMMDDWAKYQDEFIQAAPIEYKKVLQEEALRKIEEKIQNVQRDY